jgi:hypothetical protein
MDQAQLDYVDVLSSAVSPADREPRMKRSQLHLVDAQGHDVLPAVKNAIEVVFRWVLKDFPNVDPAMISEWAEELGSSMNTKHESITSPERYAYSALKGKVHDWLRTKTAKEESVGVGHDLERLGGIDRSFQRKMDHSLLFDQLRLSMNERERYILVLLLEGETSPAVTAQAFGLSYAAAAKAIQRVKERVAAASVSAASQKDDRGHGTPRFCETKG